MNRLPRQIRHEGILGCVEEEASVACQKQGIWQVWMLMGTGDQGGSRCRSKEQSLYQVETEFLFQGYPLRKLRTEGDKAGKAWPMAARATRYFLASKVVVWAVDKP